MSVSTAGYMTFGSLGGTSAATTTTSVTVSSTSSTWWYTPATSGTTVYVPDDSYGVNHLPNHDKVRVVHVPVDITQLKPGKAYDLPDGGKVMLDDHGNYRIEDQNAKVIYKANRLREFNPYVNASDLLEDFIRDMKQFDVRQSELLGLPVNVFIHWLILKAAERDGDAINTPPPQAVLPKRDVRCLCCGRFLPRRLLERRVYFCAPDHLSRYLGRLAPALPAPLTAGDSHV